MIGTTANETITFIYDENGNEVSRLEYTPYGSLLDQSAPPPTDRLHTGQRFETGLQLYDYRARFYDPLVGSFLSADSIVPEVGQPRGWNRFAYVYGNPVRYSDPSGHCAEFGDDACWGMYERITFIDKCDDCETIVTGDGIIPLHEGNYYRLRSYRENRIVNPVDYEIPPALEAFHIMTTELPDAYVLGVNAGFISQFGGTLQGPTVGYEAVLNSTSDTSVFFYDGVMTGPGVGGTLSPYFGGVWNLENNQSYTKDFESLSVTLSPGEGGTVTVFWAPDFTADKPFGIAIGPAAGYEASVVHSRTYYRELLTNRR